MNFTLLQTVACVTLSLCAMGAQAQHALTVYAGYRGGGSFEQARSPYQSLDLQGRVAGAASLDWDIDAGRQLQLFTSYQSTEIAAPGSGGVPLKLTVSYLHLGGTNFFEGAIGHGPYVAGGLGVTWMAPGQQGLSDEFRPSMSLGLGYQLPLAASVALRVELRGYATLVNSEANLFCSGGCVFQIKGQLLTQAEVLTGLSVAF
jgi:hypothetical protein